VADKDIRVVIVDDERLFAELMRVALKAADGIEVQAVVHDVKAAIAALHEYKPDVVIADYHLPDGTGADLARAVRGSLPDTSVLVLTADPSAATLNDVARSGAVGHMTKGRGLTEVVDSVRSAASGEILFAPSELQRLLLESAAARKVIEPLTSRELEASASGGRDEHVVGRGVARDLDGDAPCACAGRAPQARRALAARGRGRGRPARTRHSGVVDPRPSSSPARGKRSGPRTAISPSFRV